jgi:hypothetical protein
MVRHEIRQAAAREGGFGGFIASALPDAVIDAIVAQEYGPLSPGRCLSLVLGRTPHPASSTPRNLVEGLNYDGQWVADVPVQGSCPAAHMTLFVHGTSIVGSVRNPLGISAINGQIGKAGDGQIQIDGFGGRVKFSNGSFTADYFNACGERRAIGRRT